jgi:hypothetical protein
MLSCEQSRVNYNLGNNDIKSNKNVLKKNLIKDFYVQHLIQNQTKIFNEKNESDKFDSSIYVDAFHENDSNSRNHYYKFLFLVVKSGEFTKKKIYITHLAYLTKCFKIQEDHMRLHINIYIKCENDKNQFIYNILGKINYPRYILEMPKKSNNYIIKIVENESTHEGIHIRKIVSPSEESEIRDICKKRNFTIEEI